MTVYLLIAASAIVSRVKNRSAERPFRMPLWPFPPIIAILGVILALTQQEMRDLIITAVLILIALIYWFAYLRLKTEGARQIHLRMDKSDPYEGESMASGEAE